MISIFALSLVAMIALASAPTCLALRRALDALPAVCARRVEPARVIHAGVERPEARQVVAVAAVALPVAARLRGGGVRQGARRGGEGRAGRGGEGKGVPRMWADGPVTHTQSGVREKTGD